MSGNSRRNFNGLKITKIFVSGSVSRGSHYNNPFIPCRKCSLAGETARQAGIFVNQEILNGEVPGRNLKKN
jgi:hypothetical protein